MTKSVMINEICENIPEYKESKSILWKYPNAKLKAILDKSKSKRKMPLSKKEVVGQLNQLKKYCQNVLEFEALDIAIEFIKQNYKAKEHNSNATS